MQGMELPNVERWSAHVAVVRGLNPGLFTGPGTNTFLVGTGRERILLDTGAGVRGYVPLLEQALTEECGGAELGEILATHIHPDHIGGAVDVLRRFGERPIGKRPWAEKDSRYAVEIRALDEGDVIRTEGATLRAYHTPGHSEDHLCFYLEEDRALFTGDVILGAGTTVIPLDGGDMGLYMETLERILELEIDVIYPGHGPQIPDARGKVNAYIQHRRTREAQILRALEEGASTVERIVDGAYQDTPRALHSAAAQSVRSNLVKLEREGRAARGIDAAGEEHWSPT